MVYRVWFTRVWSLSLNSGYGLPGYGRCGFDNEVPTASDNGRGNQKKGDASTDKERGTPAQTRKGGRQHRQGKGDASTDKEGGKPGQRAGEGQEIFLHGICPSGRASRRGKTHAKNPSPLLFVLVCLSPSLPVLT